MLSNQNFFMVPSDLLRSDEFWNNVDGNDVEDHLHQKLDNGTLSPQRDILPAPPPLSSSPSSPSRVSRATPPSADSPLHPASPSSPTSRKRRQSSPLSSIPSRESSPETALFVNVNTAAKVDQPVVGGSPLPLQSLNFDSEEWTNFYAFLAVRWDMDERALMELVTLYCTYVSFISIFLCIFGHA